MPEPKKDQVPLDPNADETSAAGAAEDAAAKSAEEALEAAIQSYGKLVKAPDPFHPM